MCARTSSMWRTVCPWGAGTHLVPGSVAVPWCCRSPALPVTHRERGNTIRKLLLVKLTKEKNIVQNSAAAPSWCSRSPPLPLNSSIPLPLSHQVWLFVLMKVTTLWRSNWPPLLTVNLVICHQKAASDGWTTWTMFYMKFDKQSLTFGTFVVTLTLNTAIQFSNRHSSLWWHTIKLSRVEKWSAVQNIQ